MITRDDFQKYMDLIEQYSPDCTVYIVVSERLSENMENLEIQLGKDTEGKKSEEFIQVRESCIIYRDGPLNSESTIFYLIPYSEIKCVQLI